MAVSGITGSDPILLSTLGSRQVAPVRPAPLPAGSAIQAPVPNAAVAAPAAPATTPAQNGIQQIAELINAALLNLGVTPAVPSENLLIDTRSPLLTVLEQIQNLTPLQQSALLENTILQNLNFVPPTPDNILLINETPPAVEASGVLEQPNQTQGNALQVNETLTEVGVATSTSATLQPVTPAPPAAPAATAAAPAVAPAAAAATAAAATTPTPTTPTPTATAATTTTTTTTTTATVPVAATFLTPDLTPATLPLTLFPDRTPYSLVVYQVNDQAPPPRPPEPIGKEVVPIPAVTGIRPTGETRLRQLLQRVREAGRRRNVGYNPPPETIGQAERSIRATLIQVNADMAAHGLPLHFVFTKNENGFALELYDCSYSEACLVSYEVPLPAGNLPGVLGNLQHEAGIIVDTKL